MKTIITLAFIMKLMKQVFDGQKFAKAIRQKRLIDLDIDLRECAKIIGISFPTLSRCENGRIPELLTYAAICNWLRISMNDFVSEKKSKK